MLSLARDKFDAQNGNVCLNLEELERKKLKKLYESLSVWQKKEFIAQFVDIFDQKSLQNIHLSLESLRHNDFEFKQNRALRFKTFNSSQFHKSLLNHSEKLSRLENDHSKPNSNLPSITENCSSSLSKKSFLMRSDSVNMNSASKSSLHRFSQKKISLDKFVRRKDLESVDQKWDLRKVTQAGASKNKRNTQKSIDFNLLKAGNLIDKIKIFFHENYSSSLEFFELDEYTSNDLAIREKNNSAKQQQQQQTRLASSKSSQHDADRRPARASSYYLKKLNNKHYDRKLWNSLNSSHDFSYIVDHSLRDYGSDFNIIKTNEKAKNDDECDYDAKTQNQFENVKSSTLDDEHLIENDSKHATKFQAEVIRKVISERSFVLEKLVDHIRSVKELPTNKKYSLLFLFIDNESRELLQHFSNQVKKRIKNVEFSINNLPDHILIKILSRVDDKSLDVASLVCKRWHFIANTTELWLYKCKLLGKKENLGNIESILIEETLSNEDIDWKQAYAELKKFIDELKASYLDKLKQYNAFDVAYKLLFLFYKVRKLKRFKVSSQVKSESFSYENFYQYLPNLASNKSDQDQNSSLIEKEPAKKVSIANQIGNDEVKEETENVYDLYKKRLFEQTSSSDIEESTHRLDEKNTLFVEHKSDLMQAKDILNKIVPNFKLRWKLEGENPISIKLNSEKIMYDLRPIKKIKSLTDSFHPVTCMDYDEKRFVTGGLDRAINVYDLKSATHIGKLEGHRVEFLRAGGVRCLYLFSNRLCSGSWDSTVIIWNMISFEQITVIASIFRDTISCLYFDYDYLICGSHDKSISVLAFTKYFRENFNENTKKLPRDETINLIRCVKHHEASVTSLAYDGLGCIVSSDIKGEILLIDISNGHLLAKLIHSKHIEPITKIKLVGALVMASTTMGKVYFWNRKTLACESILECHNESPINAIQYLNRKFYTAGGDGFIKEWDLSTLACLRKLAGHSAPVEDILVFNDKLISCGKDFKVIYWDMRASKKKKKMKKKKNTF